MKLAGRVLTRGADGTDMPDGIKPPKRGPATEPLQLSTVFRGVQVLQTAITGLPIVEQRGGRDLPDVSPMVLQPDVSRSRRDFIADIVASLVLDGNAFTRIVRDWKGEIVTCEMLPPQYVTVTDESDDPACPDLRFSYLGHAYTADDVVHSKFLNVPGRLRGLGPISAAREEIDAAQLARDYKARFFTDGSNLKGYLRTSENITQEAAQQAKASWKASGEAGDIKVVGKNLEYVPLSLKPADLQFLETQKFDTTQIARLLGIPASIMLAAVDGSNLTYSNIEQSWIEFADYTLAAYTGEIEEIFNRLLPRGRTAKFDWDSSQRANMSDRYTAYKTAIEAGFLTVDDVRRKEGLPALGKEEDQ
jgi:HK97 family phage portal protein